MMMMIMITMSSKAARVTMMRIKKMTMRDFYVLGPLCLLACEGGEYLINSLRNVQVCAWLSEAQSRSSVPDQTRPPLVPPPYSEKRLLCLLLHSVSLFFSFTACFVLYSHPFDFLSVQ